MSFPDNSANDVHSLLALLRSAQDGPPPTATPSSSIAQQAIPTGQQLTDLLTALNSRPPPQPPRQTQAEQGRRELIEPFGPVLTASPAKSKSNSASLQAHVEQKEQQREEKLFQREFSYAEMSFAKALPIITELLSDKRFRGELQKMKQDQDALERRLWAKGEKIKADHDKSVKAERDIAKIARQPITTEKTQKWAKSLSTSLTTFHTQQCLPALDGLAVRHRQRLKELGVPGLGGDDERKGAEAGIKDGKARQRIKRIIEVLEGGLEE
ncbi:hypothetical protein L204_102141 [Cryptococcus depauperatus]|nr:hypothetical protein L204_04629 [Cryptococcus depauperatus CBS 7855]